MAFCANCGTQTIDGVKFCPTCGKEIGAASERQAQPVAPEYQQYQQPPVQQALPGDAEANKTMAILSYIIFFIPLLTGDHKKSPFVKFHANQGLVLAIASFISQLLWVIPFLGWVLAPIILVVIFVFALLGIISAVKGEMKPLPGLGKLTILK
ncbi:MAG: zinc-ribbon domain-containing protein [Oscillospiraceae bacterium]|jgi:uncharacterized membrane protein|nr:zinc-ribbon domain-containing protein [Oscillospiraceae bacterium]